MTEQINEALSYGMSNTIECLIPDYPKEIFLITMKDIIIMIAVRRQRQLHSILTILIVSKIIAGLDEYRRDIFFCVITDHEVYWINRMIETISLF